LTEMHFVEVKYTKQAQIMYCAHLSAYIIHSLKKKKLGQIWTNPNVGLKM